MSGLTKWLARRRLSYLQEHLSMVNARILADDIASKRLGVMWPTCFAANAEMKASLEFRIAKVQEVLK